MFHETLPETQDYPTWLLAIGSNKAILLRAPSSGESDPSPSVVDRIERTSEKPTDTPQRAHFALEAAVWAERCAREHNIGKLSVFASNKTLSQLRNAWPPRFRLIVDVEHPIEIEHAELTLDSFLSIPDVRTLLDTHPPRP